jgi:hypothetical protein
MKCRFYGFPAELKFAFGGAIRIAKRVVESTHAQNTIGAKPAGNREQARRHYRWNS